MKRIFSVLWLACFLGSCLPRTEGARLPVALPPPWRYADLRALDPADAPDTQDLLAAYLRQVDGDLQIRLDYLDLPTQPDSDLHIHLARSGATVQIIVPAAGAVQALAAGATLPNARLRVLRDATLDTMVVSIHAPALPGELRVGFEFSIWLTLPGSAQKLDELSPTRSDAPPPDPVRMLLAFSNVLPAATPAQALRSWDGAHSGPRGVRHGLRGLLDAVEANHTPVWLAGLDALPTLSALDVLGATERVRGLAQRGLLVSVDMVGGGSFVFGDSSSFLLCYIGYTHFTDPLAAAPNGPSQELRRALGQPGGNVLVTGGDLAHSSWGEPKSAADTLGYLANRPWIRFLNAAEISRQRQECAAPQAAPALSAEAQRAADALAQAPHNPLADAARQTFDSLLATNSSAEASLRVSAFGQVGLLLAAAQWAKSPAPRADCHDDLDWDGAAECILASTDTFAVIDLEGGYIPVMVALADDGPHQLIAPSVQFAVGLSDPSEWDSARGLRGDPRAILGAFDDRVAFRVTEIGAGEITLANDDGRRQKRYRLLPHGLRTDFEGQADPQASIPLGLDGWRRVLPGWAEAFREAEVPNGWRWGLNALFWVEIRTNGGLSHQTFTDSLPWLRQPEDPNFGYPAGHFLPFPLALATIQGTDGLWVEIEMQP